MNLDQIAVFDFGSHETRGGFSRDDAPKATLPSIVAFNNKSESLIGNSIKEKLEFSNYQYPLKRGCVNDMDLYEKLVDYTFKELNIDPPEYCTLITEPLDNSKENQCKLAQLYFETFCTVGFYWIEQPVLALFASGRTTGVIVDVGENQTQILPCYDMYSISKLSTKKINIGSGDVTDYLLKQLNDQGIYYHSSYDREIVRAMKEDITFTSETDELFATKDLEKSYKLPDGKNVILGEERYQCNELLFKPYLNGFTNLPGVVDLTMNLILECDLSFRQDFRKNIVLSGGGTLSKGFPERFQYEAKKMVSSNNTVRVTALPERKYSTWIGAAIISSLNRFSQSWISKDIYDESGLDYALRLNYKNIKGLF